MDPNLGCVARVTARSKSQQACEVLIMLAPPGLTQALRHSLETQSGHSDSAEPGSTECPGDEV
eukprot:3455176-Amphidinium_carterae.1